MCKDHPDVYLDLTKSMEELGTRLPGHLDGFRRLHLNAMKNGALSTVVKELIALSIAITVRCDGCIAYHVHDALSAGAAREEILETIGVAVLMGGGPSVVYGTEALNAMDQFEKLEPNMSVTRHSFGATRIS
jgi:AhpD family alkylhydroperoxidase